MEKERLEPDTKDIALKIFEKFHNRGFHPTTAFNHIRVQPGFSNISRDDIMRGIVMLYDKGIITLDHLHPFGDHYAWPEQAQKMTIEEAAKLLSAPVTGLTIRLDIQLDQKCIPDFLKAMRAHVLLYNLENKLRDFISTQLEQINKNWIKRRIDPHARKKWESNKKKEREQFPFRKLVEHDFIYYSTFEDLTLVIKQNENWQQVFQSFFGRVEGIVNRIAEAEGIRHTVMHNRQISDEDLARLKRLHDDILSCIH